MVSRNLTFHPITQEELDHFVFDMFRHAVQDDPEQFHTTSLDVAMRAADDRTKATMLADQVYARLPERVREGNAADLNRIAATIAGYLHPYWYARGTTGDSLANLEPLAHLFGNHLFGNQVSGNQMAVPGYVSAQNVPALLALLESRPDVFAKVLDGHGVSALSQAIDYATTRGTGLLEADGVFDPVSGRTPSDHEHLRAWFRSNELDHTNLRDRRSPTAGSLASGGAGAGAGAAGTGSGSGAAGTGVAGAAGTGRAIGIGEQAEMLPLLRACVVRQVEIEPGIALTRPFSDDLSLVLAYQSKDGLRPVNERYLERWGAKSEELFAAALGNVASHPFPGTELAASQAKPARVLHLHNSASLFVASWVPYVQPTVGHLGIIVGLPSRHTVLCHKLEYRGRAINAVNLMLDVVLPSYENESEKLSRDLYWVRLDAVVRLPLTEGYGHPVLSPPPEFLELLNGLPEHPEDRRSAIGD